MAEETMDLFAQVDDVVAVDAGNGEVPVVAAPPSFIEPAKDEPVVVTPSGIGSGSVRPPGSPDDNFGLPDDCTPLAQHAEDAYLAYAISVVKGRALPQVGDGQKPVQTRILYAMHDMGLHRNAKHVKSARVVGQVLGLYHPHGDQSVYDAMVRISQDFSLRYPLVDGQGNFGSRDGDGAAAMRYTEARLTPIAELLLSEIDKGTVDFVNNYDNSTTEPTILPARLPFLLLNGASGIAVGMATEIPPHNIREVSDAIVAFIERQDISLRDVLSFIKGPDFPGGGQIISSFDDIYNAYDTGRGSLRLRARWEVEQLDRGQWRIVVNELPHGVSTKKILEEIEDLVNPKAKKKEKGKDVITAEQAQLKQLILSYLDGVRDESGKDAAIRLCLEPRSKNVDPDEFMATLLHHTSLETSAPINLTMIGNDGRPQQKGLLQIMREWVDFRFETVTRRTRHRLGQVDARIHILEGRHIVFLNIDEVIKVIRNSDNPKEDLISRFNLSEIQAEDILEIRLRQLARLEGIKIEQELAELRAEKASLEHLLADRAAMTAQIVLEIREDTRKFGDDRRTLIEAAQRAVVATSVPDEPITILLSKKLWARSRTGHGHEAASVTFKEGDALLAAFECRSTDTLLLLDNNGRAYSVQVSQLPGGRGDGVPLSSLVDLQAGGKIVRVLAGAADQSVLLSSSAGYGFVCNIGDMIGRNKAGKAFMTVDAADTILAPVLFDPTANLNVAVISDEPRMLIFPMEEMKRLSGGGKGVQLMGLNDGEKLVALCASNATQKKISVAGTGRGGQAKSANFNGENYDWFFGKRARRGRKLDVKFVPDTCSSS